MSAAFKPRSLHLVIQHGPGLARLDRQLDACRAVLHHHHADPGATRVHALTGVAFRNYAFHPDDNHAWRQAVANREWDAQDLVADNFGAFESLGEVTGWEPRAYAALSVVEQLQLADFELRAGRPLVAHFADGSLGWLVGLSTGDVRIGPPTPTLVGQDRSIVWDNLEALRTQASPIKMLVALRPYDDRGPVSRQHALQVELLRFALAHAHSGKEIWAAGDAMVSSGLRAWETRADLLANRWNHTDAEGMVWWSHHLEQLATARQHAAAALQQWASAATDDPSWARVPGDHTALAQAAACYLQQAGHLLALVVTPVTTPTDRAVQADVMRALRVLDVEAVAALRAAVG